MGPGRSSSLRIGDDSSAIVGSGQARNAFSHPAVVAPRMLLGRLVFPWIRIKGK